MRFESSVTSISWIPSEAITGPVRLPLDVGIGHYDDPPPDAIDDVAGFVASDRCRFANELRAWAEFDTHGRVVDAGYSGDAHVGGTSMRIAGRSIVVPGVANPLIQLPPERADGSARFVQTAGGRTGAPMPRPVRQAPFVRIASPTAWTTLALTIHADGSAEHEVLDTSPFPRHWIYDADRQLSHKSSTIDFQTWAETAVGDHTPWGDAPPPQAHITAVESALERELSSQIMRTGGKPEFRRLEQGAELMRQGDEGRELMVLLDGMVVVEVDGEPIAELGPGAVVGERAVLEGGVRTATLRALTPVRVAVAHADQLDPEALTELSEGHRREEQPS